MPATGLREQFALLRKILSDGFCLRTAAIGLALIAMPVVAAFTIAERQSMEDQKTHAALFASEILRRSEAVSEQIATAFQRMKSAHSAAPCSEENIHHMVRAAADSGALTAVGYVQDNHLLCSSFGLHGSGIALGAPDFLSRLNIFVWASVALPGIGGQRFLISVDKVSGYASILHPEGPFDLHSDNQDIRVGLYGLLRHTSLLQRGDFKPEWGEHLAQQDMVQFFDGQFVMALKRSRHYDYASFAAMPAQLKLAFKNHELFLVYQPIVELATGRWMGAEALIRWRRPNGEMVPPDVIIPIAESSQLIERITDRVIDLFAMDATSLLQAYPAFYIGINLSAGDFQNLKIDKTFVDTIGRDLVTSRVVQHIIGIAKSLKLAMISEGVEHQEQADYLQAQGVEFAQGWLFGRPMAIDALRASLNNCPDRPKGNTCLCS